MQVGLFHNLISTFCCQIYLNLFQCNPPHCFWDNQDITFVFLKTKKMVSTTKKVIAVGSATVLGPVVAPFVLSFFGFTAGGKK